MRSPIRHAVRAFVTSLVLGFAAIVAVGASPQARADVDPLPALLSEVHALRIAMEQQAAIGPRLQLTLARLNIEEQRVSQLTTQLDTIRQQLAGSNGAMTRMTDEVNDVQRSLDIETDPARRRQLETAQRDLQMQIRANSTTLQELRTRESEATQALGTEQARWIELNSRLDELDRLLAPVR
jgi:chromosome segregation ATPase